MYQDILLWTEAIALNRRVLALHTTCYGTNHSSIVDTLVALAGIERLEGFIFLRNRVCEG